MSKKITKLQITFDNGDIITLSKPFHSGVRKYPSLDVRPAYRKESYTDGTYDPFFPHGVDITISGSFEGYEDNIVKKKEKIKCHYCGSDVKEVGFWGCAVYHKKSKKVCISCGQCDRTVIAHNDPEYDGKMELLR